MDKRDRSRQIVRFGVFEADLETGELSKNGARVPLQSQPFQVCAILLKRSGELVTREELRQKVWPEDTFVDFDQAVNTAIKKIRIALGDEADNPRFIQTLPGRGYRFICPVLNGNGHLAEVEYPAAVATPVGEAGSIDQRLSALPGTVPDSGEKEAAGQPPELRESADTERNSKRHKSRAGFRARRGALTFAAILLAGIAGTIWYLHRPLPPPQITKYAKITHDGRPKFLVGTDGNRLYFNQGSPASMAQVGVTGGETAQIPFTVPHFDSLVDVSPDGSSFLIISATEGVGYELWSARILGGSLRRLSDAGSLNAAFSPDGNSVAYSTYEGDIYVVRSDGTGAHKLAKPGGLPYFLNWSPDGSTIRFRGNDNGICNGICEISSNGSNRHPILPAWHNSDQWAGRWSPDGEFFLFLSENQIWAIDERRGPLRHSPTEPIRLTSGPTSWDSPVASKDGKKIFAVGINPRGELSRFDTRNKQLSAFLGGISAESVSFSKDGRFVAYVSFPEGILWKANSDGSNSVQLSDPPIYSWNPKWSPDGTQIVFTDVSNPFSHVVSYIVSSKGGAPRPLLPGDNGQQSSPTWSADGQKIIFEDRKSPELRVVDIASGQITALPGSKGIANPLSSPNGRFIAGLVPGPPAGIRIFDFETQRWSSVLVTNTDALYHTWSRDSRFIYFLHHGPDQGVFRIRTTGGQPERVADLKDMHQAGSIGFWFGLDPTDAPLLLRDVGSADIYALTLEEK